MKGTVVSYDYKKGYGIIVGENKEEVFVYEKDQQFLTLLDPGDEVEYQIEQTEKGPKAVNVKILKDSLFRS
ncbi:MAG: cold shock domain-containing protein [Thermoplasmatota archaeon]